MAYLRLVVERASVVYSTFDFINQAGLGCRFSFFAIMPLARVRTLCVEISVSWFGCAPQLLGEATEQVALDLGETLGALLNASLGNLVELILGIAGKWIFVFSCWF
jgi:Ca2+/H+ antiporter